MCVGGGGMTTVVAWLANGRLVTWVTPDPVATASECDTEGLGSPSQLEACWVLLSTLGVSMFPSVR